MLNHNGAINNFSCSHHSHNDQLALVVSSCRNDSIIRLWDVPLDSTTELSNTQLIGHQGKIECFGFHPVFSDVLASSASDGIKLWNLKSKRDQVSLKVKDDAYIQSFSFDYFGECMAAITSKSLLQIYDPREGICSLNVETQHTKVKSAKVVWLHPDSLVVSTGFDKSSNRTLFLWDVRRLDQSLSQYSFGSSFAPLEPIWDSELPILYLPARNENLDMMELRNGILHQISTTKMEKTASYLELLPKSLCDTSKCEIATFLRLGSDQSIDTVGIHVPRVNSDLVFQQDLYPCYSLNSISDSTFWFDKHSSITLNPNDFENPRISTCYKDDACPIKDEKPQIILLKERFVTFNAFLERTTWWYFKKWVKVSIYLRESIYIVDAENNSVLVAVPEDISSLSAFDDNSNMLSLIVQGEKFLLQLECVLHVDQFFEAVSSRIVPQKSCISNCKFSQNVQVLDPFQKGNDATACRNWLMRYITLEKDAVLLIYDDDNIFRQSKTGLKILDLQDLLGIFRMRISSLQCPSAKLSILPIYIFRLVFVNYHYLICTKSETQLDLWISCVKNNVFNPPGLCITDPNHVVNVEILKVSSGNFNLQAGQNYTLLILHNIIQFSDDKNSVLLSITRSSIGEIKFIDDISFLLIFSEYNIVEINLSMGQDAASILKLLKHFMSRNENIPSTIGINSEEDLKMLKNESIKHVAFSIKDKSCDSHSKHLIAFGNHGEMEACMPNSNSIYGNKSYVLETNNEIYYWFGPKSKRRIHAKALDLAVRIRKYRNLRPKITLVENDDQKTVERLFTILGSFATTLPSAVGQDLIPGNIKILKINSHARHTSDKLISILEGKRLSKTILHSAHVYIVTFQNLIFLWCGRASTYADKELGRGILRRLAQKEKAPGIGEFVENHEHPIFWQAFDDACGLLPIQMNMGHDSEITGNIAHSIEQKEIDLKIFQAPLVYEDRGKDLRMVGISIFRIVNFHLDTVKSDPLFLHSSNSYIVLYLYNPPLSGLTKAITFFWQGSNSAIIEKGAAALLTMQVSTGFDGDISQERVEEGKESIQFCRLLGGINIIDSDVTFPIAFDTRSNGLDHPCKSYQISDFRYIPWNINHVILFVNQDYAYIWKGQFCFQSEIDHAENLAKELGIMQVTLVEDFEQLNLVEMGILNTNKPQLKSRTERFNPRFFQTVSVTGAVDLFPLQNITQSDLRNVTILDNLETIYVWVCKTCNPLEIKTAITTVNKLISSCTLHHESKCFVTFQGHEPFDFKTSIHGWRDSGNIEKVIPAHEYLNELERETYSMTCLITEPPDHLDLTKLESYLDHESFVNLFQMTREEYNSLPVWKRNHLKKAVGFF